MNANDLISRAAKYDEGLARDIQRFIGNRQFGLVYEESKPEFVRLYNKPVVVGDTVNILPPRGIMENMTSDTDEHEVKWRVVSITNSTAHLECLESDDTKDVSIDDIVSYVRFDQPIYAGLKEVDRVERGGDKPYHVVINGENFHALEALMFAFQGKVDCIYIDPPYNNGATDWKYNNNYVAKDDKYRHSKWLTFMEDRLKLAKKLLNPKDSVLIVTIDEKEYLRLGLLLEQEFPNANIQMVSIGNNPAAVARDCEFGRFDEYAFFVMLGEAAPLRMELGKGWVTTKGRTHNRTDARWDLLKRSGTRTQRKDSPGCFYPIFAKDGKIVEIGNSIPLNMNREDVEVPADVDVIWPIRKNRTEGNWQLSPDNLRELWQQGFVRLGKAKGSAATVYYLKRGERNKINTGVYTIQGRAEDASLIVVKSEDINGATSVPSTQWRMPSHDSTQYGTRLLEKVFDDEKRFTYPKSLYAVEDCLRFFVSNKPHATIIDFFAGSGTTAHAVMRLNHQDNGKRRSISVTNNEISAAENERLTKMGLRYGDDEWERIGICNYVTIPRLRSVITGRTPNGNPIPGDYGLFTEEYAELDADVIDPDTGKKIRGKVFKKVQIPDTSVPDPFPMSDGFNENAVFFDLEYLEPAVVQANMSFDEIAPLLWLKAGSKGRIIHHCDKFDITDSYAVLFDYRYIGAFTRNIQKKPEVKTIYIVTDHDARYRDMCATFPDRNVIQLYESYLRSFEISCQG